MKNKINISNSNIDDKRKSDHIELAFNAQENIIDNRFWYEPMLTAHPNQPLNTTNFLGKTLTTPIWVSSMTGGTEKAFHINQNLAKACKQYGMGMGLGSCRPLLDSKVRFADFDFRKTIGDDLPFFANLGIAQLEYLLENNAVNKIIDLVDLLAADGLIIHVNPLQEWLQPEGDKINHAPIETIKKLLDKVSFQIIVKEVGQGFGYESLKQLMQLPIAAIEFAAHGGTNFAKLEMLRNDTINYNIYEHLAFIGHQAGEMTDLTNMLIAELKEKALCTNFIISGGIKNFLDGYYYTQKINANAIYGQASTLLQYADQSYEALEEYLISQIKGLQLANAFLKLKK